MLQLLQGAVLGIDDEDESTFTITTLDQKTFHFQGEHSTNIDVGNELPSIGVTLGDKF